MRQELWLCVLALSSVLQHSTWSVPNPGLLGDALSAASWLLQEAVVLAFPLWIVHHVMETVRPDLQN